MIAEQARYDKEYVEEWLLHAGELMSMWQVSGTRPATFKSTMPDYVREFMDAYSPFSDAPLKFNLEAHQVETMNQVYGWVIKIPNVNIRRVLMAASLVNPESGRRKYSWVRIAKMMRVSDKTAKAMYQDGLSRISGMLNVGKIEPL